MRVVIVEDEFYARKALMKLINELNLGLEISAEAETGKQAVEFLKRESVDLVITDINMPEMDGLELAKYVSEHCPGTEVVIESGYADFNYAQRAIRYGVKNYLTKPVKPDELIRTIQELIEKKRESFQYLSIPLIVKTPDLLERLKVHCGNCFGKFPYRIFLFQGGQQADLETVKRVRKQIQKRFDSCRAYDLYFGSQGEIVVFVFDEEIQLEKNTVLPMLKTLLTGNDISCGYSQIWQKIEELGEAYKECIYAINRRLLAEDIFMFGQDTDLNIDQILPEQEEILLYESVVKCNYEQARAVVDHFFIYCKEEAVNVYSLYTGIMQIFSAIGKAFFKRKNSDNQEQENRYLLFSFQSDLYQFKTLESLRSYILSVLEHTCGNEEENEDHTIIVELIEYVARNYRYDISLKELACHKYFINPSYLSRLFKAKTGMNFSKYLIDCRMKRARELLCDTDFKINEIADCVGYNDTSYFIHTFRKYYHMTPEQYRTGEIEK